MPPIPGGITSSAGKVFLFLGQNHHREILWFSRMDSKVFPDHYTQPIVDLLSTLSLSGKPEVHGTSADRRVLYAVDVDAEETLEWKDSLAEKLRANIVKLHSLRDVRITDIKAGVVPSWNILEEAHLVKGKILGYNHSQAVKKVEQLAQENIITADEKKEALSLLKPTFSPLQFLVAKKELRFGVVRWTPQEVKRGYKTLRDDHTLTWKEALQQPLAPKVDFVAWIEPQFVEFSFLYFFKSKGNYLAPQDNLLQKLKEDILVYASKNNWMKVARRIYSYCKFKDANTCKKNLQDQIFNTDLGRLYSLLADAETLQVLEETATKEEQERIQQERDGFRARLALINTPGFKDPVNPHLKTLTEKIHSTLQPRVKDALLRLKLLPLPKALKV